MVVGLVYNGVLITKNEDKILNGLGLQFKMPENWDREDIFARYKNANIEIINHQKAQTFSWYKYLLRFNNTEYQLGKRTIMSVSV